MHLQKSRKLIELALGDSVPFIGASAYAESALYSCTQGMPNKVETIFSSFGWIPLYLHIVYCEETGLYRQHTSRKATVLSTSKKEKIYYIHMISYLKEGKR